MVSTISSLSSHSDTDCLSRGNILDATIKVYNQEEHDEKAVIETVNLEGEIDIEGELADGEGELLPLLTTKPEDDMDLEGDEKGDQSSRVTQRNGSRLKSRDKTRKGKRQRRIEDELEAEFGGETWGIAIDETLEDALDKEWVRIEKEWKKIEDHYQKIEREWSEIKEWKRATLQKAQEEETTAPPSNVESQPQTQTESELAT